jgi:hypothetical protein
MSLYATHLTIVAQQRRFANPKVEVGSSLLDERPEK